MLIGQHTIKYSTNTVRYTPKAAFGEDFRFASMICCPTFNTSTTPIIITRLVVLIILVIRLMARGIRRRKVCGMITLRYVCP